MLFRSGGAGIVCLIGIWILVKRNRQAWCIAAFVLLFPLPYYLTHVLERYRFPSEPLIVLCASAAVLALLDRWHSPRGSRAQG